MSRSFTRSLWMLLGGAVALLPVGCGGNAEKAQTPKYQSASADDTKAQNGQEGSKDGTAGSQQVGKPKPMTVADLDEKMPEGPAEAVVAYMEQLATYEPRGVTQDAKRVDGARVSRQMMMAGDRVLLDQDATPAQRLTAANHKMKAAVELLSIWDEPKAEDELLAYCAALKRDMDPALQHLGREVGVEMTLGKLLQGNEKDAEAIVAEMKTLLADEDPRHTTFNLAQHVAEKLIRAGYQDLAVDLLSTVAEKYVNDKDKNTADQAIQLRVKIKAMKLDFSAKFAAFAADPPQADAAEKFVASVKELLSGAKGHQAELESVAELADRLERIDQYAASQQVLALMKSHFFDSKDPEVVDFAKLFVGKTEKRLALIGQPLTITGNTLDGQPFDASKLKGKVVLVDFWATWCGPCIAEIPNVKKYYDLYKDKGFEVIGYNIDRDREDVDRFFSVQKLPWVTVVDPNAGANEGKEQANDNSFPARCGVHTIPFLILIGRDGKVVALHTRGERLGEKLAELLGPVEEKPAAEAEAGSK